MDLGNVLEVVNDWGNFDRDGLQAVAKSFEEKLRISDNAKNLVNETVVGFGAKTVNFIFGAMFILSVIIVWILVPAGVLTAMISLLITISIGVFLWIAALIYRNSLDEAVNGALSRVNKKLGTYAEEFATDMIGNLNIAASEYSKVKKSKKITLPKNSLNKDIDIMFEE